MKIKITITNLSKQDGNRKKNLVRKTASSDAKVVHRSIFQL
jgi:hypothetical protein